MKIQLLLAVSVLSILFSCKEGTNTNSPEEPSTKISDQPKEAQKFGNVENKNEAENFLISEGRVGNFVLGESIPGSSDKFQIEKIMKTRFTEGGKVTEPVYVVSKNGNTLLHLRPRFENREYDQVIQEIWVLSPKYKTADGIGVNSTLEEFKQTYPDSRLWYTYVSDRYVLESNAVSAQFLLDENDFIGEMNVDEVMEPLKISDFKEGATIKKIRLYL
ncbi:MAG TPA: hypothetical protein VFI78_06920 [Salinimicrobium sp.]|nr:hypothetical protein [Salinimicrobium sp.]